MTRDRTSTTRRTALPWRLALLFVLFLGSPATAHDRHPPAAPGASGTGETAATATPAGSTAAPGRTAAAPDALAIARMWTFDPWATVPLGVAAVLYALGLARLGRRSPGRRAVQRWEALAWWGGWTTAALALVSPIDALSDALFSVHMTQHELLMLVAAPLIVLGKPATALWALPERGRRAVGEALRSGPIAAVWRPLGTPLAAWIVHATALWIWHLPVLYQAALRSEGVHFVQHAAFFFSATLFWWVLVRGRCGRLGYGMAVLYVFTTAAHGGALGALMTVAPRLWYPIYAERTPGWGVEPLVDQQVAGLLMWVPAGVLLSIVALALFAAWLGEAERRSRLVAPPALLLAALLVLGSGCVLDDRSEHARRITGGEPDRGRTAIAARGCGGCHQISGVPGAHGLVGPPLDTIADRAYLAGRLPNTPENLMLWVQRPQEVEPGNVMPNTGVGDAEARDIAAYLYTLR